MRYFTLLLSFAVATAILIFPASASDDVRDGYTRQSNPRTLTEEQSQKAAQNYQRYCALCHGENREGHANDHAPSLRSKSLMESGVPHSILRPLSYGREGTAMGGYLDEVGGPLTLDEAWNLTYWLFWQSGATRVRLSEDPVEGDSAKGAELYANVCASCHGTQGEGVSAPALWNPSFLAHNKDEFIRYAIRHGREDTPMVAFENSLSPDDIDNITAFLRSQADGTALGKPVLSALPAPEDYIINPTHDDPDFTLKDDLYVMAADLNTAMQDRKRMVLLDTRVPSVWQRAHLEGAVPVPYYTDVDDLMRDIPKDVQIVAYCSCPRAAADYLVGKLRDMGYTRTAVMWEGIFGWMNMGFPVVRGELEAE
ncbi:c-type cytochrome [Kordiimonas sp. SCSIO 12610]|uniref:c-type cytochrome n=1 Tax=Kordiimonas sp. SCSIO 12610 TaxID=2829597 RepID=UPI00210AFA25|nr:c-type cytochrome [Kordiimonas sp. SCSIO 12610]UTW56581.1 c-type cytochrome [Kordiimonas sp. SCSIO 12610]